MFSDTNFLRFLEFVFAWISVIQTIFVCTCLISIFQLCKCSLFRFLFVFKNLYCVATTEDVSMGGIVKFVYGTSQHTKSGTTWKMEYKQYVNSNQICKCKPTVSTCALSLTLRVHYSDKQTMKEALRDAAGMSQGFDK